MTSTKFLQTNFALHKVNIFVNILFNTEYEMHVTKWKIAYYNSSVEQNVQDLEKSIKAKYMATLI